MAAWYEPAGGASRATCVAQIVTDINSYVTTSTDGLTTFDIDGFMALAATRLAAIPDPTATGEYYVMAGVLRSTNVRPDVEVLLGSLESVQVNNAGYDLQPHIVELQRLSDAVTAYYNRLYNDLLPDLLDNYLAAGSLELGLPAVDDTTTETRFYRTTFVTDWGEESAPSDVSVSVEVGSKDTVTIGRGTVPSGRNISYWRVYRSAHGSETSAWLYTPNSASDQGVAVATTTFTDDVPNSELQEVCPSLIWSEPPTNLRGLVGMANGINVGFFDNVLCPTPAYVPYAFPEEYRVTVEWPIVGLGAWEQSVFVGTTGHPYFLTGADAANLTARKLNSNQACVSPRSICPVEEGVIYASPDGLCLATSGGVRLITSQHFTREEWQDQDLANLVVRQHDGVVYWVPGVVPGSGNYRWADANSFQGVSFTNDARTFNMNVATTGAAAIRNGRTGVALSGKVYCEFILTARAGSMAVAMGSTNDVFLGGFWGGTFLTMFSGNAAACGLVNNGYANQGAVTSNAAYTFTTGDVIGVAVDASAGKIWYSKNGAWISGSPSAGTSPTGTFTPGTWYFATSGYSCSTSSGTTTVDIYPRGTAYEPPSGFSAYQPPDPVPMYALDLTTGKLATVDNASGMTTLHVDAATDTLFTALGTDAIAITNASTRRTGVWERLFVAQAYATYAWLQVQSTFLDANASAASVTVTVSNASGTVLATTTVTSVDPVKITPFYEREFYVKVTSKAQVSAVYLATSTKELQAI